MQTPKKIREVLSTQLLIPISEIKPDTTLASLGADSLDIVEITVELEELFGCDVLDEEMEKWVTVADIVRHFEK